MVIKSVPEFASGLLKMLQTALTVHLNPAKNSPRCSLYTFNFLKIERGTMRRISMMTAQKAGR